MILLRSYLSGHIRIKRTREYYDAGIGPNVPFGAIGFSPVVSQNFLTNTTVPSWLDVSATTGNRMLYDSTGRLTYAPNNLNTYSQQFNNAAWTKSGLLAFGSGSTQNTNATTDPFGLNNAALITEDTAAGRHFVYRNIATAIGTKYVASIYAKAATRTFVALGQRNGTGTTGYVVVFNLSTGAVSTTNNVGTPTGASNSITSIGNGWYRISVSMNADTTGTFLECGLSNSATPTYLANIPTYTGDGSSGLYIYGAQLEAVTYQTAPSAYTATTTAAYYGPRFDYDPSTLAAKGLLIEESRANLLIYSEQFGNVNWSVISTTVSANTSVSPDGNTTADRITASAAASGHYVFQSATTSAAAMTCSVYAKYTNNPWVAVRLFDGTSSFFGSFNVQTGVAGAKSASATTTITSVGNGWYRLTVTATTAASASSNVLVALNNADSASIVTWTPIGTETVDVWGAQLEAGSFATSYIPTVAASVTRVADIIKLSGAALTTAGAATGSAIVQTASWLSAATAADVLSSATTRRLLYSNGSNTVLSSTNGTTGLDATIGGSGTFTGGAVRSAIAWNTSGRSLVANNGTLTSDAVNLGTNAAVTLGGYGSTTTFDGWVAALSLYNQRLPDATLKSKSVVGSPL